LRAGDSSNFEVGEFLTTGVPDSPGTFQYRGHVRSEAMRVRASTVKALFKMRVLARLTTFSFFRRIHAALETPPVVSVAKGEKR
jgi:hypothetical protein